MFPCSDTVTSCTDTDSHAFHRWDKQETDTFLAFATSHLGLKWKQYVISAYNCMDTQLGKKATPHRTHAAQFNLNIRLDEDEASVTRNPLRESRLKVFETHQFIFCCKKKHKIQSDHSIWAINIIWFIALVYICIHLYSSFMYLDCIKFHIVVELCCIITKNEWIDEQIIWMNAKNEKNSSMYLHAWWIKDFVLLLHTIRRSMGSIKGPNKWARTINPG